MAASEHGTPVAVRLPPELLEKLDAIATERGESRSEALRHLLEIHEPEGRIPPDSPFFAPPLPAPPGPPVDFLKTRYDHVMKRGRR